MQTLVQNHTITPKTANGVLSQHKKSEHWGEGVKTAVLCLRKNGFFSRYINIYIKLVFTFD